MAWALAQFGSPVSQEWGQVRGCGGRLSLRLGATLGKDSMKAPIGHLCWRWFQTGSNVAGYLMAVEATKDACGTFLDKLRGLSAPAQY